MPSDGGSLLLMIMYLNNEIFLSIYGVFYPHVAVSKTFEMCVQATVILGDSGYF